MEHTLDTLMRIDGGTDNDKLIASQFCKEALAEVQTRADAIAAVSNLGTILDADVLREAASALAGIRHITVAVETVAEFHVNGELGPVFGGLSERLSKLKEIAEQSYLWLSKLFPSTGTYK